MVGRLLKSRMPTGHLNQGSRGWGGISNVAVKFCLIHLGSQWIGWTVGKPVGLGPEQADLGVNPGSATCLTLVLNVLSSKG